MQIPELWSANLPLISNALHDLGRLIGARLHRVSTDDTVRAITATAFGVALRAQLPNGTPDPDADPVRQMIEGVNALSRTGRQVGPRPREAAARGL